MKYLGDYIDNDTIYIYFTTNDGSGGAVAPSTAFEAADVVIYKNNSATQKATTNGITMTSPFDSVVGLHLIAIDTSNDTGDAGFWAAGNDYSAILKPDETVDSQTVVHPLGQFSIENRSALRPTTAGRTLDVSAGGEAGLDWANVGSPTTAVDLSATDIQLCDTTTTNTDMVGTDSAALASVCTEGRLAELDAANLPSDVDDILTDTAVIGALGAGLTNIPWNASWDAEVQSEVDDALIAKGLDHLVFASVTGTDIADNSIIAKLVSSSATADWDSYDNTTDSLQAIKDNTAWDTATGFSTHTAANVRTEMDSNSTQLAAIVADTNELQVDDVPGLIDALNDPTAATIADAVWDELQSAHVTVGSFGIIASEIAAIPTTAMRGTDSAALASVCSEGRLAELDAANLPADVDAILLDTGTDGVVLSTATKQAVADEVLKRGASNVEGTADRHSLGAMIMIGTNSSTSGVTLTAKKPSDDTTFATYTFVVDAAADPVTGIS